MFIQCQKDAKTIVKNYQNRWRHFEIIKTKKRAFLVLSVLQDKLHSQFTEQKLRACSKFVS